MYSNSLHQSLMHLMSKRVNNNHTLGSRVGSSGHLDITEGRGVTGFLFSFHECKKGLKIFLLV